VEGPLSAALPDRPVPSPLVDPDLARYDVRLVRDDDTHARLRTHGYVVLDRILDDVALAEMRALADEFVRRVGPGGGEFQTLGRIEDLRLRSELITRGGEIVLPSFSPLFEDGTQFLSAALQVKPPSPASALNAHQDSSLIDETRWPGVYGWIPLVDTDEHNGGLFVVPGSHRFANHHRTLSVPWQFAGYEDVLTGYAVHLEVPAGAVVLFDSATVHGSPVNRSGGVRYACNNFAYPAGASLRHFYQDELTQSGKVEAFEIGPSFLYEEDIMVRPAAPHRPLGLVPHEPVECSVELVEAACRLVTGLEGDLR